MLTRPRLPADERARRPRGSAPRSLAWLLAGLAFPAQALDPSRLPTQFLYESWQDELPQQTVRTLAQTPDGYLWIGTQAGLVRFDGTRFSVFDPVTSAALESGDIMRLAVGGDGRLLVAPRGGGLVAVEAGRLAPHALGDGSRLEGVLAVAETPDGARWFGTRDHGVVRDHQGKITAFGAEQGLESPSVYTLLVDSRGVLWAGCLRGGLARFNGDRFEPVAAALLGSDSVTALLEDRSQDLWIGTRTLGLLRLAADRRGEPKVVPEAADVTVMALLEDRDGSVFVGTLGKGLLRFHQGGMDRFDQTTGLSEDKVVALLEDREGSLWVGTDGAGLNQLRGGAFRTFGPEEGLETGAVRAVAEDRQGSVWLGTDDHGLAVLRGKAISHLTTADGLASNGIGALLPARDGSLWLGALKVGLQRLEQGESQTFGRSKGLTSPMVVSLAEDRDGTLWAGTLDLGLFRRRGASFEPLSDPELGKARIWSLAVGPENQLYIGTDGNGLRVLPAGEVVSRPVAQGMPESSISTILVEADGSLWVGTYGQGLAHISAGRARFLTRQQGLPDDTVLQVLDDGLGALWMSSNKGVFRMAREQLLAVLDGRQPRLEARGFGKSDGMRSAECNGAVQPAGFRGADGRLWFPTTAGIVVVDPAHLGKNEVPPPVQIEEVRVAGEAQPLSGAGAFAPGSSRYELHYTALSFVEPSRMRFRYRMEGYDTSWIEVDGLERRAVYTGLPTGRRYRFRVMAANSDGVWNESGASFDFEVEPYFWQRPVFLLLATALLAILAWSLYQLRVRQLLRRTALLEKLVADRTALVVAQRDELENANTQLVRLNQFKSEFLGIAAHDLKNPLSVIYGYAGLMVSKGDKDPALLRVARRISASANQMLTIVSDLLDTTAMESGKLRFEREPTDLGELVAAVVESQKVMAADRQIELRLQADGPIPCAVDREKITRVVQNLTSNAIRYSKPGTPVEVKVERLEGGTEPRVRIAVLDHGPGLTPEQVARIFERFERLAAKHQVAAASTGLGLSIVKQFVEMHQGRIWVESRHGEGSTFLVELPAGA